MVSSVNSAVNNNRRSQWVLNAPKPPSVFRQLFDNIKDTVFPERSNRKRFDSLRDQSLWKRVLALLQEFFPIIGSLRGYNFCKLKFDLMAGLTIASLAIPQSVGFATLAQLSPEYGLYTCFVTPIIYSMLTSSRELVIGNVAVDSMLLASMIQKLKDPINDPTAYTNLVLTATFFVGVFQVAFGLFRLGFVVDYLSHAAIVGFLAAAGIGIGLQQMKGLFGITQFTKNSDLISVIKVLWKWFSGHSQWHPYNFIVGFSFFCFILFMRFVGRRNKKLFWLSSVAPLLSVIVSTVIAYSVNSHQLNMSNYKLEVLGPIKGGSMNPSSLYHLNFDHKFLGSLVKAGLTVAVISLTETIVVARSFASIRGYNLDTNKEILSIGITNIIGSFTSCYVTTGSLSRTALNYSTGSETMVSSIVMALTVLMSLKFLTKLLYFTPKATLAAIILAILPGFFDLNKAKEIWKVDKLDFLACAGAFFGVLFFSVEMGLAIAMTISFAKIIVVSIQPGVSIVGMLPGTDVFGDVEQYPMALDIPGILILSLKSSWLCFANASLIRERIERWVNDEATENGDGKSTFKFIILDTSNLMNIDTAGIASIEELNNTLTSHRIKMAIASPRWEVIDKLRLGGIVSKIGGRVFVSVGEAVDACLGAKMVTTI